jgi:hypothetical protein
LSAILPGNTVAVKAAIDPTVPFTSRVGGAGDIDEHCPSPLHKGARGAWQWVIDASLTATTLMVNLVSNVNAKRFLDRNQDAEPATVTGVSINDP